MAKGKGRAPYMVMTPGRPLCACGRGRAPGRLREDGVQGWRESCWKCELAAHAVKARAGRVSKLVAINAARKVVASLKGVPEEEQGWE